MNTSELVKKLAARMNISQRKARELLDNLIQAMNTRLQQGERVVLRDFGSFTVKQVKERKAYIPSEKTLCTIPAHQKLQFRQAKHLKENLNRDKDA